MKSVHTALAMKRIQISHYNLKSISEGESKISYRFEPEDLSKIT